MDHSLLHIDKTRACIMLGVTLPTLNRALRNAQMQGIDSPFAPLDGYSGRSYTTTAALKEWLAKTREARISTKVGVKQVA